MNHLSNREAIELSKHDTNKHIFLTNKPIVAAQPISSLAGELLFTSAKIVRTACRSLMDRGLELYLLILPLVIALAVW